MSEKIPISTEYIQLGQFLKLANILETGGMVKLFLADNVVFINGAEENRRGKKLYPGDRVEIEGIGAFTVFREGDLE